MAVSSRIVLIKSVPTWVGLVLPVGAELTVPSLHADQLVANRYARYADAASEPETMPEPGPMIDESAEAIDPPAVDEWADEIDAVAKDMSE
jgi:hypothetical protein